MTSHDPDIEPLLDALRSDLPEPKDAHRVRARLMAAGIIAGGVVTAANAAASAGAGASSSGLAAASGAGAKVGAVSKMAAVLGSPKALLAAGVVVGAAIPATVYVASGPSELAVQVAPATSSAAKNAAPQSGSRVTRSAPGRAPTPTELGGTSANPALTLPPRASGESAEPPRVLDAAPEAAVERPRAPRPNALTPTALTESVTSKAPVAPSVQAFPALAPSSPSTLRDETELMARALTALRKGEYAQAKSLLQEHTKRFPNGALRPERERALERLKNAGF